MKNEAVKTIHYLVLRFNFYAGIWPPHPTKPICL